MVILGFNKIDIQSPEPLGEDQILPLVPLPFVCSSEITIVPSGQFFSARSLQYVFVESSVVKYLK